MNWLDGQGRRAWLDRQNDRLTKALSYYAGPAAAPVNALAQVASMFSPAADMMDMQRSGNDLMRAKSPMDAAQNAGWLGLATLGMAVPGRPGAARDLASKARKSYTFPTGSEVGNALGRSDKSGLDLEGRPLVAQHVVGGAPDRVREQSLPSEALAQIVQERTGGPIERVAASQLPRGANGVLRVDRVTGPRVVQVKKDLNEVEFDSVARHETGHLLDEVAGQIPVDGLLNELRPLYSYGVEGRDRTKNLTLPQHQKYPPEEAPREYMAEAIRQYMAAPDTMKARAPKTAARIRKYINDNPQLRNTVQFNSVAVGAGLGAGVMDQREEEPFR